MRTEVTSSYTTRESITTNSTPRSTKDFLLTEFFWKLLQENWWGILLERSINDLHTKRIEPNTNYN